MVCLYKTGLIVKTIPCKSFKQICEQLEKKIPNSIRNSSCFFKLLYGKKKQLYGWKILSMAIRSEAENGLEKKCPKKKVSTAELLKPALANYLNLSRSN